MSLFIKVQSTNLSCRPSYKNKFLTNLFKRNISDSSEKEHMKYLPKDDLIPETQEPDIDKIRNKSRLSPEHRNILFDEKPYSEPMRKHHLTVKYNRRMYGIYGSASGVNPGIMWPTKDDIQGRKEYESVAYPFTLSEMVSAAVEENKRKELETQQIQEKVLSKLMKLDSWKKEIQDKIAKKEAEALAAKEKKDKLIEEVRRHFGYKVDPKDERFQEMLSKKQKEQKKLERHAKLEEREKKALAKLMEKNETKNAE